MELPATTLSVKSLEDIKPLTTTLMEYPKLDTIMNELNGVVDHVLQYLPTPTHSTRDTSRWLKRSMLSPFIALEQRRLSSSDLLCSLLPYLKTSPVEQLSLDALVDQYVAKHSPTNNVTNTAPTGGVSNVSMMLKIANSIIWDLKRKKIISSRRFREFKAIDLGFLRSLVMKYYRLLQHDMAQGQPVNPVLAIVFQQVLLLRFVRFQQRF